MEVMSISIIPISRRELLAYRADVKGSIFRQIRELFSRLKEFGFTQKQFAQKIDMDEGQLSRRLRGDYDLQLETLSDLARGLDCRIEVRLVLLASNAAHSVTPASPIKTAVTKFGKLPDSSSGQVAQNDNSTLIDVVAS